MRSIECLVLQLGHALGSSTRPFSMSTSTPSPHAWHVNHEVRGSGMTPCVRVTMPLIVTSVSMSLGLRSRMRRNSVSSRLKTRLRMTVVGRPSGAPSAVEPAAPPPPPAASRRMLSYVELSTMSSTGITSCG